MHHATDLIALPLALIKPSNPGTVLAATPITATTMAIMSKNFILPKRMQEAGTEATSYNYYGCCGLCTGSAVPSTTGEVGASLDSLFSRLF